MSELIYDALMLGRSKKVAGEEYLTAIGEKEPVKFCAKEKTINFQDITDDTSGIVHLELAREGYAEIEVYTEDAFIRLEKTVITSDDFEGGESEFTFCVVCGALHDGMNFGRIIFRTPVCGCSCMVCVSNKTAPGISGAGTRKKIAALCETYMELRLGGLFQTEWQEKTLGIIGDVNGSGAADLYLMLYKANVLIAAERYSEARYIIEFAAEQLPKLSEKNRELSCYFHYINSLYEMNDDVTADVREYCLSTYAKNPSWRVLWILLYLDKDLSESPERVLDMIREEFCLRKCASPVMYFEAYEALRKVPKEKITLSDYFIRILDYAARRDYLDTNMACLLSDMIWQAEDEELSGLEIGECIRLLEKVYNGNESKLILKSLCRLLILAGRSDEASHKYYEAAVNAFIEIKGLYNYFIFSCARDTFTHLPRAVCAYLSGRENSLGPWQAYYYACLIKEKKEYGEYYDRALFGMQNLSVLSAELCRTDSSLEVIYEDLLESGSLPAQCWQRMTEIFHTSRIEVENPLIVSALAFNTEFGEYQECELSGGRAYLKIFTDDTVVLFKDKAGNLYANIPYRRADFPRKETYAAAAVSNSVLSRYMFVGDNLKLVKELKAPAEILDFLKNNLGTGLFRASYEQRLCYDMLEFILAGEKSGPKSSVGPEEKEKIHRRIYDLLENEIEPKTRALIIETMIDDGESDPAVREIERDGFSEVSDEHIKTLARLEIAKRQIGEPRASEECLTEMACRAFMKCAFDKLIFDYLREGYDGDLGIMVRLYLTAKNSDDEETREEASENVSLAGRILRKMIDTGEFPDEAESIFTEYYEKGDDGDLKIAYLTAQAERYLAFRGGRYAYVFELIENETEKGRQFEDHVMIAYLLYEREGAIESAPAIKLKKLEELLRKFVRCGIMLEEFKDYGKYFSLPAALVNSYTAEKIVFGSALLRDAHLTKSNIFGAAPVIEYEISHNGSVIVKGREAMREAAKGCYTRQFSIFSGDSLEFSIQGEEKVSVDSADIGFEADGSRFADVNGMILNRRGGKPPKAAPCEGEDESAASEAENYYIKSGLADRIFTS